jgi:hypothetical protein
MTSDVLHYYCIAEYIIDGKDSITCQVDGTWAGSTPQCYRTYELFLACIEGVEQL